MSDYASVVERTRKAFSAIAKTEAALALDPRNKALQVNLTALKRAADRSENDLDSLSFYYRVDLCKYRLAPEVQQRFKLVDVTSSLSSFQYLFTQIFDAVKNGPKSRATYGREAEEQSGLEIAYSFSGSLGFVLTAQNERTLFDGDLDKPIDVLLDAVDLAGAGEVRKIASELGIAVVKRIYDWSDANLKAQFATDILWKRSDGRLLGKMIPRSQMRNMVELIAATSDESVKPIRLAGMLVGGDLTSRTFHFVSEGDDYRGSIASNFVPATEMVLGKRYIAIMNESSKLHYATERTEVKRELVTLIEPPNTFSM